MNGGMLQLTGDDGELRLAKYERITDTHGQGAQKIRIQFNPAK